MRLPLFAIFERVVRGQIGERVSRKDAKIGARVAKKPSEKIEILRVCFAGVILVAAPPRRNLSTSDDHPWAGPCRQSRTRLINSPPVSFVWMRILVPAPSNSITQSAPPIVPSSNSTKAVGPPLLLISVSMFARLAVFAGLGVDAPLGMDAGLGVDEVSVRSVSEIALRGVREVALWAVRGFGPLTVRVVVFLLGLPSTLLLRFP